MEFDFFQQLESESSRANFDFVTYIIGDNEAAFSEVMRIALTAKPPVSFRAAAVVETVCRSHPNMILPYVDQILRDYFRYNHDGVKRGFLKSLMYIELTEDQEGRMLDLGLQIISHPKEKVAAKAYALQILAAISEKYPDIRPEILMVVQTVEDQGSAGWQVVCREVFKKLKD